jgi:hypothetical protein
MSEGVHDIPGILARFDGNGNTAVQVAAEIREYQREHGIKSSGDPIERVNYIVASEVERGRMIVTPDEDGEPSYRRVQGDQ